MRIQGLGDIPLSEKLDLGGVSDRSLGNLAALLPHILGALLAPAVVRNYISTPFAHCVLELTCVRHSSRGFEKRPRIFYDGKIYANSLIKLRIPWR